MIPKVIHYCWFGGRDLPRSAKRCISSWRRFFPDYEIKRWDETNFDVDALPYARDAYKAGKYAFVSDVARFVVLYREGGIYFDTDVEAVRNFDDIIAAGPFMGRETAPDGEPEPVATGLGIGAEPGMPIYDEIIRSYAGKRFECRTGESAPETVVTHVSRILESHGFTSGGTAPRKTCGITIYPSEYFCPLSTVDGILRVTPRTCSIHWYDQSWQSPLRKYGRKLLLRLGGPGLKDRLKSILLKH